MDYSRPIGDPNAWKNLATSYLRLGDLDRAFEYLQKMVDVRSGYTTFLKVNPTWDSVRDDPRYRDLLGQMDLDD